MAGQIAAVAPELLSAISAEVQKQNAAGAGWSAPSTYLFSAGVLLEGTDVANAATASGLSPSAVVGLGSLGGLLIALGGVLLAHGH
jgi:hypothetical protein